MAILIATLISIILFSYYWHKEMLLGGRGVGGQGCYTDLITKNFEVSI